MILYLHGFRSTPHSTKARMMAAHMLHLGRAEEFICPQLSASPRLAIAQAEQILSQHQSDNKPDSVTIIGSSLGGFYATWLAEKFGCKAILLNPAVKPPRDLARYVGVSTVYGSDAPFEFKAEYVDELNAYAVDAVTRPERYFLIAATGDEVLDWRDMVAHYPAARQIVIEGGDHGLSDFVAYLDEVMEFADA